MTTITEDIRARVERGAAWLDEHRPGWVGGVDPEELDLSDPHLCILGQLDGHFVDAVKARLGGDGDRAAALGFAAPRLSAVWMSRAQYDAFVERWQREQAAAWRDLITARRAAA